MYQLMDQARIASNNSDDVNIELEANDNNNNTNSNGINQKNMPLLTTTAIQSQQSPPNLTFITDHMDPLPTVATAIQLGYKKAFSTSFRELQSKPYKIFLSAMLSGSYLGFAISISINAMAYGWDKVSAALLFPFGFLLLILSGNSLATGNFAVLPMALTYHWSTKDKIQKQNVKQKNITVWMVLLNWLIVYCGNFAGALLCLFLLWGGMTHFDQRDEDEYAAFKESLCNVATHKVITYYNSGAAGWFASFFNGCLANWLVTLAVILSIASKTTIGKVISVYLPISIFVALGFEHAIVNLFVLPGGLLYKCDTYNFGQWWAWNQIPVTLGNIIGGATLTGMMYFAIYSHKL